MRAEWEMLVIAHTPSEVLARAFPPAQSLPGADDRVTCAECQHHQRGQCGAWLRLGAVRNYSPIADLPRRCDAFRPLLNALDQREGFQRWPTLDRRIVTKEARK